MLCRQRLIRTQLRTFGDLPPPHTREAHFMSHTQLLVFIKPPTSRREPIVESDLASLAAISRTGLHPAILNALMELNRAREARDPAGIARNERRVNALFDNLADRVSTDCVGRSAPETETHLHTPVAAATEISHGYTALANRGR